MAAPDDELVGAFISATERAYQGERQTARVYRQLAGRVSSDLLQALLLNLAVMADRRAARYAARLQRLGAGLPPQNESISRRIGRWMLVRDGPRLVFWWAERVHRRDRQPLALLAGMIRR